MQVKAVVVPEVDRLEVQTIALAPPGQSEVLIENHAAGVCHSDLHTLKGELRVRPPLVLGHEGSGVVVETGKAVTTVQAGDKVIYNWLPACNSCGTCLSGMPNLCEEFPATILQGLLPNKVSRILDQDGEPLKHHLGVATMAEYMVTHERNVIPYEIDIPMATSAIVGCAVVTGMGAVWNTAQARPGQGLAVVGCGGVGLSALMGAKAAGCSPVIGVDRDQAKLRFAEVLGADLTLDVSETDFADGLKELYPAGVDCIVDTVGAGTMADSLEAVKPGGKVVVVGMHAFKDTVPISPAQLVAMNRQLLGSFVGTAKPHFDIPRILHMYSQGTLDLDALITKTYGIDEVQSAFDDMVDGRVVRGVLEFKR